MKVLKTLALTALVAGCSPVVDAVPDENAPPSATTLTRTIRWRAQAEIIDQVRPRVLVTVAGRNVAPTAETIYYGACNIRFKLRSETQAAPVWDSEGHPVACIMPLYSRRLAMNDTVSFRFGLSAADIMGDSIPAGRYLVTAEAYFSFDSDFSPGDRTRTGELTAGSVLLNR